MGSECIYNTKTATRYPRLLRYILKHQQKIADLFGVDRSVITKHLKNIFTSGELVENSVCSKIAHTAAAGKSYPTRFYKLDAIILVGYRVNSCQATHFRIWATEKYKLDLLKFV